MALLSADDPAPTAGSRQEHGVRVQDRDGGRVPPAANGRTTDRSRSRIGSTPWTAPATTCERCLASTTSSRRFRSTSRSWVGTTTRTTTRTRTVSSSRTSGTPMRSPPSDRIIFHRYMVHSLAQQRGLEATFMPKPFANLTGNGLHCHMSLWDAKDDTPLFEEPEDPRGLGLSKLAYHFLGGLLKHAKAYIGVTASTVNSYKRLIVGAPTSGATWSPVYVVYGGNNRTQMIRVPAPGRFEDRTIDGAANPYLTSTVILAAGLDGIENELDPGRPEPGQHVRGNLAGAQAPEDRATAGEPARRGTQPPEGRGPPRGAWVRGRTGTTSTTSATGRSRNGASTTTSSATGRWRGTCRCSKDLRTARPSASASHSTGTRDIERRTGIPVHEVWADGSVERARP